MTTTVIVSVPMPASLSVQPGLEVELLPDAESDSLIVVRQPAPDSLSQNHYVQ